MENIESAPMPEPEKSPTENRGKSWVRVLAILYALSIVVGMAQVLYMRPAHEKKMDEDWLAAHARAFKKPAIAVVSIYGVITIGDQKQLFMPMSGDRIARRLRILSEQDDVKAVVLRINSPGGSVGAVQEIYDEVLRLRNAGKKVIVSMGDVAASGGYYIAAGADKIFADPGTLTGSIGVIFEVGNFQELFKKIGVRIEAIKSAEHKDIGSPFRAMTDKEHKILQDLINNAYDQFVDAIVTGRKMDREKVLALADGRIYSGAQAKSLGLIDELGNMEKAITKAAELAGIHGRPRILYEEDPWNKLLSIFADNSDADAKALTRAAAKMGVRFAYLWDYAL